MSVSIAMPLSSDAPFQRLWRTQFPTGSPALTVRNTFINVGNDDPATLHARRGRHSKTLPATLPISMQRLAFLDEFCVQESPTHAAKFKEIDSATSTAGSELGLNETYMTYETASAASSEPHTPRSPVLSNLMLFTDVLKNTPLSFPEQAHQQPAIHPALPCQDPVIHLDDCLPSLRSKLEKDGQEFTLVRNTDVIDDDCSPLRRWYRSGESSFAHQQGSGESSLATGADDSSPTLAPLPRQQHTHTSPSSEVLPNNDPGEDAPQTRIGETSLFSIDRKCSTIEPQSPLGNQPAELLHRMVDNPIVPAPRPKPLSWTQCRDACCFNVRWTLDARKVRGNDKQAVSPPLELPLAPGGRRVKLRLMIYPKVADLQIVQNFRSSRSRGFIQVKCEPDRACPTVPVRFALAVGSGCRAQGAKGPVDHDFAKNNICGLPRHQDDWDFFSATDPSSMTVSVILELTRIDITSSFQRC